MELTRICDAAEVAPIVTEISRHVLPSHRASLVLLRESRAAGPSLVLQVPRARGDLLVSGATALGLDPSAAHEASSFPLMGSEVSGPGLPQLSRTIVAAGSSAWLEVAAAAGGDRLPLLLTMYAAHAVAVSERWLEGPRGRTPAALLSMHSHAEAFVHSSRQPEQVRARLDAHGDRHRDVVSDCVDRGMEAAAATAGPSPGPTAAGAWAAVLKEYRQPVQGAFQAGELSIPDASTAASQGPLEQSPFHQQVKADATLGAFLGSDPGFLTTRVLTSLLYQQTYAVGFELVDRFLACYLVARELRSRSGVAPAHAIGTVTSLRIAPSA